MRSLMHLPIFRCVVAVLSVCGATSLTTAHDFWVEPSASQVAPGSPLSASLRVGMACPGDVVRRKAERIERFELVGPSGPITLAGEEGLDPAGTVTPTKPGLHAVVYRSKRVSIELAPAEFEAYLKEEGLEKISRLRAERGETGKPGREVYSRCAKALVMVGDTPADAADMPTNLRYEIVASGNPMNLNVTTEGGAALTVQVLFEGKPLAGALVKAMHCGGAGGSPMATVKSDENGRATLPIGTAGRWVIASTEMIEAPKDSGAQWESLWASLVFEVK